MWQLLQPGKRCKRIPCEAELAQLRVACAHTARMSGSDSCARIGTTHIPVRSGTDVSPRDDNTSFEMGFRGLATDRAGRARRRGWLAIGAAAHSRLHRLRKQIGRGSRRLHWPGVATDGSCGRGMRAWIAADEAMMIDEHNMFILFP